MVVRLFGLKNSVYILFIGMATFPVLAADSVKSLRYGVTLYHYYQQDYFAALTELMAAQQLSALDVHADNAELLRGGMSLSYGMDSVAEKIFVEQLSRRDNTVDADKAWFYLAKLAWRRGELDRASAALGQMSPDYPGPLADEANYLRSAIALRRNDETRSAQYAELLPDTSTWRYYHYYNSGAARAAGGDWSSATDYFNRFDALDSPGTEARLLRDKAYTASGFAHMSAGDWRGAERDFSKVRLDSPLSDRALLGFGWAAAEKGDFQAALTPWQVLSGRTPSNESVRAGLLALPYAYEQMGKHNTALSAYRRAAQVYGSEISALNRAIDVFRSADLNELLDTKQFEAGTWLSGADYLPLNDQTPFLRHLVSRQSFQLAVREWSDLQQLSAHLSRAKERLELLAQVDADQRHSWLTVMEEDRLSQLGQQRLTLQQRTADLRRELQTQTAAQNHRWFVSSEQSARWQRLDRAQDLAKQLAVEPDTVQLLELYRGLMRWEDSEQYPARHRQRSQQLKELEQLAGRSEQGIQSVQTAMERGQQETFPTRIVSLEARVQQQQQRAISALYDSGEKIRQVAVTELETQLAQLTRALGQSRLAIARIFDVASTEPQR